MVLPNIVHDTVGDVIWYGLVWSPRVNSPNVFSLMQVHFLVCMTSNYVRLKYETKTQAAPTELQELKRAKQELEESREAHVNEVKVEEVKPGNPFD